ncbi:4Fe-4S dicluster domain-containing protein [Streptomyces sp. NPDC090306]|uniref:4Fe-4S dicluster domain-containing protein n=1 Tax=Streptomyces sp. NPDC090306 TaxID=3365961 RepID=UPI0038032602
MSENPPSGLLSGPEPDPARDAGHTDAPPRVGFFTDTSVCIGCKACEVACKEWNAVPEDGLSLSGMSYDNTLGLGASTWRHVAFIEQRVPAGPPEAEHRRQLPLTATESGRAEEGGSGCGCGSGGGGGCGGGGGAGGPASVAETVQQGGQAGELRWLMSSDVCKHCTHAACLDVCPTGSLFRTEFGTVVVQQDICNGCGYCVPACPYGVIEQRPDDGRAFKCTMCYDRLTAGQEPACAKACPTQSIQFGPLDELRERAALRVDQLRQAGVEGAQLYGEDPDDGVGGDGAFFLLLDRPEVYGLPPDPVVTTRDLPAMWKHAGRAAGALVGGLALAFVLPEFARRKGHR